MEWNASDSLILKALTMWDLKNFQLYKSSQNIAVAILEFFLTKGL